MSINSSVPPAPRGVLFERIRQLELDKQWRERAIKVRLCIHCGHKLSVKGFLSSGEPALICDTCGREYH